MRYGPGGSTLAASFQDFQIRIRQVDGADNQMGLDHFDSLAAAGRSGQLKQPP